MPTRFSEEPVFATRAEHDVGGWAVPYFLTGDAVHFLSYGYAISDPVFNEISRGELVSHGTSERGGYSISVTELADYSGMVVYWRQLPGGLVVKRARNGFTGHRFPGTPSAFKAAVRSALNFEADLWVGDTQLPPPEKVEIRRGRNGEPEIVVAYHQSGFSFAVHNLTSKFHHTSMFGQAADAPPAVAVARISEKLVQVGLGSETSCLDAAALDRLLSDLVKCRTEVEPPIPLEFKDGEALTALDPAWRTFSNLHPDLPRVLLALRHPGHGWVAFVLPDHEADNLGRWLIARQRRTKGEVAPENRTSG